MVSDDPEKLPVRHNMTSNAAILQGGIRGMPSDRDMRIIGTKEAKYLFGSGATIIDGVTVRPLRFSLELFINLALQFFINDPSQL